MTLHSLTRAAGWLLGFFIILEAILLWLAPAEQTLGQVVKLVYLHGALIRACLLGFSVAGLLGVAALIWRRPGLVAWLQATQSGVLLVWLIYLISSMVVTYLAWGVAIAWGEPRVAATIRISIAALVICVVVELLKQPALTALGSILLAGVAWWATQSAGVIRHPLDPIGTSSSVAIRGAYAGIVAVMLVIVALIIFLFRARQSAGR
jgi:hypothetical protein